MRRLKAQQNHFNELGPLALRKTKVDTNVRSMDFDARLRAIRRRYKLFTQKQKAFDYFSKDLCQILGAAEALFFLVQKISSRHYGLEYFPSRPHPKSELFVFSESAAEAHFIKANKQFVRINGKVHAFFENVIRSVEHDSGPLRSIDFFPIPGAGKFPYGFFLFLNADNPQLKTFLQGKEWSRIGKLAYEIVRDVVARKQHKQEIKERDTLLRVAQKISSSLSLDKVLLSIIESLRHVVPLDSGAIFLINRETREIEHATDVGYPDKHRQLLKMKIGEGVSGWVAKTGRAINVPDVKSEPRYINADPKTKSEVAVPIRRGNQILGVFNLESHKYAAFTPRQIKLLEAFAGSAAVAIQNAWLYRQTLEKRELEQDLNIARNIQQALLPHRLPNNSLVSFAAFTRASRQVGGDFYDALRLADGNISIAVADVSGKSVPGALMMVALHTIFRGELRRGRRTSEIITQVNRAFSEKITVGHFATFFHAIIYPRTKRLVYCNAGHNPVILVKKDCNVEQLEATGIVLGIMRDAKYAEHEVQFEPGDVLVAYSDGITEAENERDELFGKERLVRFIQKQRMETACKIKAGIIGAVEMFSQGKPNQDDITLIVAKMCEK